MSTQGPATALSHGDSGTLPITPRIERLLARGALSALGTISPVLRVLFSGLRFPIGSRVELLTALGGPTRLLTVGGSDGQASVVSPLDVMDTWSDLDSFFPMRSLQEVASRVLANPRRYTRQLAVTAIGSRRLSEVRFGSEPELSAQDVTAGTQVLALPSGPVPAGIFLDALGDPSILSDAGILDPDLSDALRRWNEALAAALRQRTRQQALDAARLSEDKARLAGEAQGRAAEAERAVAGARTTTETQQAVDMACAAADEARTAAEEALRAAQQAAGLAASLPGDVEAQQARERAEVAALAAMSADAQAQNSCRRARDIASIGLATIRGHVTETDPFFDDDVDGATIEVRNLGFAEIANAYGNTDGGGNYSVTGRFGHSARLGSSRVLVTMSSGSSWGDVTLSKTIEVGGDSPPAVNFSFDAPGFE